MHDWIHVRESCPNRNFNPEPDRDLFFFYKFKHDYIIDAAKTLFEHLSKPNTAVADKKCFPLKGD